MDILTGSDEEAELDVACLSSSRVLLLFDDDVPSPRRSSADGDPPDVGRAEAARNRLQ